MKRIALIAILFTAISAWAQGDKKNPENFHANNATSGPLQVFNGGSTELIALCKTDPATNDYYDCELTNRHTVTDVIRVMSKQMEKQQQVCRQIAEDFVQLMVKHGTQCRLAAGGRKEMSEPDYAKIIAEDDKTLKQMREQAYANAEWRTVIVGLPIIRKLLHGEDVVLNDFHVNLIPDDVLFNNRPKEPKPKP